MRARAIVVVIAAALAVLCIGVYRAARRGTARRVVLTPPASSQLPLAAPLPPLELPPLAPRPRAGDREFGPLTRARLGLPLAPVAAATGGAACLPACSPNCSGRGVCLAERVPPAAGAAPSCRSRCACAPGWDGAACETRDPSPCNTPEGGRVLSRCAGACDEDRNRCLCGPGSRFPDRSMQGCADTAVQSRMAWQTPGWGGFARGPREGFWGKPGAWCDARTPDRLRGPRCKCYEATDTLCSPARATFCVNQCSGRGDCRRGFCACEAGAYGADCSLPLAAPAGRAAAIAEIAEIADAPPSAAGAVVERTAGPRRTRGAHAGVRRGGARRPLIYVYELPAEYNALLVARRLDEASCSLRSYGAGADGDGRARWSANLYGAEVALHEALLGSAHRTEDAELADFFYVPVYGARP